jgi:quercetin dioxygenase-like cupin family protein
MVSAVIGDTRMRKLLLGLTVATVSAVALPELSPAYAQQPKFDIKGFTRKTMEEQVLAGYLTELNGKYKMTVSRFTFEPGGYVGPHHHAGPGFRCVLSGEVTNVHEDGKSVVYKVGECYWETGDQSHTPRNNGDKEAVGLIIELLPVSLTGSSLLPVPQNK